MPQRLQIFWVVVLLQLLARTSSKPYDISLSSEKLEDSADYLYSVAQDLNRFELFLADASLLDSSNLFIVLEAPSSGFQINVFEDPMAVGASNEPILEFKSTIGNIMIAITSNFYNARLDSFRTTGTLRLSVVSLQSEPEETRFKLRFVITSTINLPAGKVYTSYLDPILNRLPVDLVYNGKGFKKLKKLRFQLTLIHHKANHLVTADVKYGSAVYELNTVFGHIVGGVISAPMHDICQEESCKYRMNIKAIGVRSMNIESYIVEDIEKVSLLHHEEYYDRIYDESKPIVYELPFEPLAAGLDYTFTLIPVSGISGLYVNAITLPESLDKYDWQDIGPMAKRITVRHKELTRMRALNATNFIAVTNTQPGEYLLKLDAHEENFRGRLNAGVIEAGYLEPDSVTNYLYYFETFETQEAKFELQLELISGDAELYAMECPHSKSCNITPEHISTGKVAVAQSELSAKKLAQSFTCKLPKKETSTKCYFAIAIKPRGNQRTYYHLTLSEGEFHRLMVPGHEIKLVLQPEQKMHLKFSVAPQKEVDLKLFFQMMPQYGTFNVYMSKSIRFPSKETSMVYKNIVSSKNSLYNAMETIEVTSSMTNDESIFGIFYVTIEGVTASSVSLKFFTKHSKQVTMHSLAPGTDIRGQLTNFKEIAYYTLKAVWDTSISQRKVTCILTPLKGDFIMFANTESSLPTKKSHQKISQDHHLEFELSPNSLETHSEFILGIQAMKDKSNPLAKHDLQYYLTCSYSNKVIRMSPGVITAHLIKDQNMFAIEVLSEMHDLLIIKSINDGFNIKMCIDFSSNEEWPGDSNNSSNCKYRIGDRQTGIHLESADLTAGCKPFREDGRSSTCYLLFTLSGSTNQKVQLGFSYNDHPFKLIKNSLFMFPALRRADSRINLIYHAEPNKPVSLYFHSKGIEHTIYTKLVREDHFDDQVLMNFPTKENYDADRQTKKGQITQIFYSEEAVSDFGRSPEILISVRSNSFEVKGPSFQPDFHFTIQTSMDAKEIQKTQIFNDFIEKEEWRYYFFFNNGNSDSLRVYVCATTSTVLNVLLSKGYQSRPPFTNEPLLSKSSLGSVEIVLSKDDLDPQERKEASNGLKGYYVVAVKAASQTNLSLFWNNKEDLNYIELIPNVPTSMAIDKAKNLYFSFFAHRAEDGIEWPNARVTFYLKTDVRANFYVLKSKSDLAAPSNANYKWKASLGPKGGITSLRIPANDPDYCSNCLYIGYLDSLEDGQVTILSNYNYSNDPIELIPGFTIPEELAPNEKVYFRVFNPDADLIDLTATMLNGFVNVYISDNSTLTDTNYGEKHELSATQESQKMIVIAPFRYSITEPHDYFIMIHNPKLEIATFTLAVDKNNIRSPIEPGMPKSMHLAPGEYTEFYYTPTKNDESFEVRFELKQVLNEPVREQSLSLIQDYLEVYHINTQTNNRFKLQYTEKVSHYNRVRITFDVKQNTKSIFYIHIYNPVGSSVLATVDLMVGGYKMLTYNEFALDRLLPKSRIIYEGFGQPTKLFFVDVKHCHGSVGVEFFQGDYESVARNKTVETREIKNDNSVINYISLNNTTKAFVRVTNHGNEPAVFQLGMFTEKDLQSNPYNDIAQGNGGRVDIDSERHVFKITPVKLKGKEIGDFRHKVTYTLFLTGDLPTMRYAKRCGEFMIRETYEEPVIISKTVEFTFNTIKEIEEFTNKVEIVVNELPNRSKLYGVVVATVELFPTDISYFSPLRAGKIYYDEFIFKTPMFQLPTQLIISTILVFALFVLLFICLKSCIFGEINHVSYLSRAGDLFKTPEVTLEFNLRSILESEYYRDMQAHENSHSLGDHPHSTDGGIELTEVHL
jgi:hypothetical protein